MSWAVVLVIIVIVILVILGISCWCFSGCCEKEDKCHDDKKKSCNTKDSCKTSNDDCKKKDDCKRSCAPAPTCSPAPSPCCNEAFLDIVALTDQTIVPGAAVTFNLEKAKSVNGPYNFTGPSNSFTVTKDGNYNIFYGVSGTDSVATPRIPQLNIALQVNGSPLPDTSVFATTLPSGETQVQGKTILNLVVGDVVQLVNFSTTDGISLTGTAPNGQPQASAQLVVERLGDC